MAKWISSTSATSITRYSTSWLLPPTALFALRALISLYAFITLLTSLALSTRTSAKLTFSYFTILGYWGLAFYFLFAATHTLTYSLTGHSLLHTWPKPFVHAHAALYATITVFPVIVTIVFWAVLSYGAFSSVESAWTNVSEHALNTVLAVLEISLARTEPLAWVLMVPVVIVLALYLGLAYLTHTTEGVYVYSFLNPNSGEGVVAGACVGILAATVVVFVAVHFLIRFRIWVTETKMGMYGKLSKHDRYEGGFLDEDFEGSMGMVDLSGENHIPK